MLAAHRYGEVDLPIFEPSEGIVYHGELLGIAANRRDAQKVVRFTGLHARGYTKLRDVLEEADRQFEQIAGFCGATVVDHTWGLYKYSPDEKKYLGAISAGNIRDFPDGYFLVAEVEVIEPEKSAERRQAHSYRVKAGLDQYRRASSALKVHDVSSIMDFAIGTSRVRPTFRPSSLWLTDIEPRLIHT